MSGWVGPYLVLLLWQCRFLWPPLVLGSQLGISISDGTITPLRGFASSLIMDILAYNKETKNSHMSVPSIHVGGLQSAGKTSLVEAIIGFPYGHKDQKTATRCPTVLYLRSDPHAENPNVRVQDVPVPMRELPSRISQHMKQIEASSRFSADPLTIEIASKNVPDLVLFDHIGFRTSVNSDEEREDAKKIEAIAANYMRDPRAVIVAVFNCPTSIDTFTDHLVLDRVMTGDFNSSPKRLDWEHQALIIANYLNQRASSFRDVTDLNNFLQEARVSERNYHFVVLKPSDEVDTDRANYEDRLQYLKDITVKERHFYAELRHTLEAKSSDGSVWDVRNDELLGISDAIGKVASIWQQAFFDDLPSLLQRIRAEIREVRLQLQKIPDLAILSPDRFNELKVLLLGYACDFAKEVIQLQQGHMAKDSHGMDVTTSEGAQSYRPALFGLTLIQEVQQFVPQRAGALQKMMQKAKRGNFILSTDRHLLGHSSYRRVLKFFEYIVLASVHTVEMPSDADIDNMANDLRSPSVFPENEIVMQMAADAMGSVATDIQWLREFLEGLFTANAPVHTFLQNQSQYSSLKHLSWFERRLDAAYRAFITERLDAITHSWALLIESKTGSRRYPDILSPLLAQAALGKIPLDCDQCSSGQQTGRRCCSTFSDHVYLVMKLHENSLEMGHVIERASERVPLEAFGRVAPQGFGRVDYQKLRDEARSVAVAMILQVFSVYLDIMETHFLQRVSDFSQAGLVKTLLAAIMEITHEQVEAETEDLRIQELAAHRKTLRSQHDRLIAIEAKVSGAVRGTPHAA